MREVGCYAGENPFVDVGARAPSDIDADAARPPAMPDVSGVEPPRTRKRLTDSFFKLVGRGWTQPGFALPSLRAWAAPPMLPIQRSATRSSRD
jgi:hypothetical protein